MATWVVQTAIPNAGTGNTGEAAYTDSGLRIDDSVTGAAATASILDGITGSSTGIKVGKYLAHLQRYDKHGRAYRATPDAGTTIQLPIL